MSHRLPRNVLPEAYTLELAPDLEALTFDGSVAIDAIVHEPTDTIMLNAADLEIHSMTVDGVPVDVRLDPELETLTIELDEPRASGPVALEASFRGTLNDQLRGFYRSTFVEDGVEHTIATTQFQSTDARRAFPCWDEPDMKATFGVTLVVDPRFTAVSNGAEVARTERTDGAVAVEFARTMVMSTYLVAFVVGPLAVTEPVMAGSTPVRIVCRESQLHLTSFGLEVAVAALAYFEDYYGIAYPADKLDMVALPDFAMGAMENLGCVTYRDVLLLVDPETATQPELQNVADVVNHELAHMWFGDLVTMSWWNGIWLNEAFATFMEMKATDTFAPEWNRWTSFGISRSQAMDIDSLVSTRPVEFPVVTPEDAEGMFDLLTYEKGAAVVRMLEQWLGESTFRDGIRAYLARHAYGNTETHDLWDALEEVSGRPVRSAMETWIFQGGYPMVEVGDGEITQRRCTYASDAPGGAWIVPVQVRRADGTVDVLELADEPLAVPATADVATFNHDAHGFYRVGLPERALDAIGREGTAGLRAVERFGLVDDTWTLALSGDIPLRAFFALLGGFRGEDDVSVWQRILGALSFIRHVASDDDLAPLEDRIGDLIGGARDRLGITPDTDEDARTRQLRGALFTAAGTIAGDTSIVEVARSIHADPDADSELTAAAVRVLASSGDADVFEEFHERFTGSDNPQEQVRYLYALPLFPGVEQIDRLVDLTTDGSIRSQNAPFVLSHALMHRDHGPRVWATVVDRWEAINDAFPSNTIVRLLTGIRWLADPATSEEVAAFFDGRPLPQGQQQLDQHLERLRVNRGFHDRVRSELPEILS